jgi:DNA-binding beta-propeller fold protein YncE
MIMQAYLVMLLVLLNGMNTSADTAQNGLIFSVIADGLNEATSIFKTPDGDLFVVETGSDRILKLDRNGNRTDSLGRTGFGDYRFDRPIDIDATNGLKIYVSDYNNRRVQIFDRRLQYLTSVNLARLPAANRTYSPTRISINSIGELFILDEEHSRLLRINRNGRFEYDIDLRSLGIGDLPVSMVANDDVIYLSETGKGIIHMISGGNYLRFIGGMEPIVALTIFGDILWAVAERKLYRLDLRGRLIQESDFPAGIVPADIAAGKDYLYLLTSGEILRSPVPVSE